MKVHQLISILTKYDKNQEVLVKAPDGYAYDVTGGRFLQVDDGGVIKYDGKPDAVVISLAC